MALLEDWLRRPAQKSVSTDQLKVFFDLFAMEALSALQRDVKLLEVSLFVLIGTLIALVLMLGVGGVDMLQQKAISPKSRICFQKRITVATFFLAHCKTEKRLREIAA